MIAHDMARAENGVFLLRIEDIDQSRARPEWEAQIYDDLRWLGIGWDGTILRQSDNLPAYGRALDELWDRGLIYPCTCNRKDILAAVSAPQEGALLVGPDGVVYPGTCRNRTPLPRHTTPRPDNTALRLDLGQTQFARKEFDHRITPDKPHDRLAVSFMETGSGPDCQTGQIDVYLHDMQHGIGDVVLARKDMGTSYHLSVVLDDAAQGITHVVRGQDLFDATAIHVLLQRLLDLPTPIYHHHRLIRDDAGKRLAKRDDARAISKYRAEGATPNDIRQMVGLHPVQ